MFYNRTTGVLTTQLPAKYAVDGFVQPLRAAYEAGNITLPYGGWYIANITDATPAAHQRKVAGEWTYEGDTASMTRQLAALSTEEGIQAIKLEANRRIVVVKGGDEPFRDANAIADYIDLKERQDAGQSTPEEDQRIEDLKAVKAEIFRLRAKSNYLEVLYEAEPFDFTEDSFWED